MAYLRMHWRAQLIAIAIGIAFASWSTATPAPTQLLEATNTNSRFLLTLTGLAVVLSMTAFAPMAASHIWRIRATLTLSEPPTIPAIFVVFGVGAFCVVTLVAIANGTAATPPCSVEVRVLLAVVGVYASAALTVALFSTRVRLFSLPAIARRTYHDDSPISDPTNDLLRRDGFVATLATRISSVPRNTPFTLSITGPWGSGKSSVLHLLATALDRNDSIALVRFNPWLYASPEAMTLAFWREIEASLATRFIGGPRFSTIRRYASLLSYGASLLRLPLLPTRESTLIDIQRDVDAWLQQTGIQLTVVVDELDRLDAQQLRKALQFPSGMARFRSVVFVLAFDEARVRRLLQDDGEYLDRIIQEPYVLPSPPRDAIDRFFLLSDSADPEGGAHRSHLDRLFDRMDLGTDRRTQFDKRFLPIYQQYGREFLPTLRHAKRLLNTLESYLTGDLHHEIDLCDFLLLEMTRLRHPTVYEDIRSNEWYFVLPGGNRWLWNSPGHNALMDEQKRKELVSEYIHKVVDPHVEGPSRVALLGILSHLFPSALSAYRDAPQIDTVGREQAEREARVCHPDSFESYFSHRESDSGLSRAELSRIVSHLASMSDQEKCESWLSGLFTDFRERRQLPLLLKKLALHSEDFTPTQLIAILVVLADRSASIAADVADNVFEMYGAIGSPVIAILRTPSLAEHLVVVLQRLLRQSSSLLFSSMLIHSVQRALGARMLWVANAAEVLAQLRRAAVDSLRHATAENSLSLFEQYERNAWRFILYQWATDWETRAEDYRSEVTNIVLDAARVSLDLLPQYLLSFEEQDPFSNEASIDFNKLEAACDLRELSGFLYANRTELERRGLWNALWDKILQRTEVCDDFEEDGDSPGAPAPE